MYDLLAPFPAAPSGSSDAAVVARFADSEAGHRQMVNATHDFYASLGLPPLPRSFWNESMFSRPAGRRVVCHASAWDLTRGDVRLKMCAVPTLEDFYTVSHEMGHLYYFQAYKALPALFRDGAHDGFHEAIGDTMALSARPPWHLRAVGLAPAGAAMTAEARVNFLMKTALEKVAFLPFGYLIDRWRWDVFAGSAPGLFNATAGAAGPAKPLTPAEWNSHWWALRQRYQGIAPPVSRGARPTPAPHTVSDLATALSQLLAARAHRPPLCPGPPPHPVPPLPTGAAAFDPGAKFHVPNAVPYMRRAPPSPPRMPALPPLPLPPLCVRGRTAARSLSPRVCAQVLPGGEPPVPVPPRPLRPQRLRGAPLQLLHRRIQGAPPPPPSRP